MYRSSLKDAHFQNLISRLNTQFQEGLSDSARSARSVL